jgi:hypothetical protein
MKYLRVSIAAITLLIAAAGFLPAAMADTVLTPGGKTQSAPIPITTEIQIPGAGLLPLDKGNTDGKIRDLADYIGRFYNFAIAIVGMIAAVMLIIGGFQYLTSGGDPGKVAAGKKRIIDALVGIVLALSAYTILFTVNPALLTFRLPNLSPVSTQVTVMPFCDILEKQYGVKATPMQWKKDVPANTHCGAPGAIETVTKTQGGKEVKSRLWCVFREAGGESRYSAGGCTEGDRHEVYRMVRANYTFEVPTLCMPTVKYNSNDMEQYFQKNGFAPPPSELAQCVSCLDLTKSNAEAMGWGGSAACVAWMNIANNGNPDDGRFNLSVKKGGPGVTDPTGFVLDHLDWEHENHMYYCAWSTHYDTCVEVDLDCPDTHSCGGYDSENIKFCEAGQEYCTDNDLDAFVTGSYAKHLGPICAANPCNATGHCNTGVISRVSELAGTDGVSVIVRGATLGFVDSSSCD